MRINMELLKEIYDYMLENETIDYINEVIGLEEDETPTFEDFKEHFKSMIISNLQYDFNIQMNMHTLIKEDE